MTSLQIKSEPSAFSGVTELYANVSVEEGKAVTHQGQLSSLQNTAQWQVKEDQTEQVEHFYVTDVTLS